MKQKLRKFAPFLAIIVLAAQAAIGFLAAPVASADSTLQGQLSSDSTQIAALNQQIAQLQAELNQVGANKKTLQNAIKTLDLQKTTVQTQMQVTQSQIDSTQLQLQQLGTQIAGTQEQISKSEDALAGYIQQINETDGVSPMMQLFAAGSLAQFWQNLDATAQVQDAVQQKTQELQLEQTTLTASQNTVQQQEDALSAQSATLAAQQQSLNDTVASKNQLLTETNNKQSTYETLLAQAQAELNSFTNFTQNAGGDNLLSNQTVCDSWGCYYNQRDSAWGGQPLDGTQYSMAADGCLVTAMAMVMTHYGATAVNPESINTNPNNFAAYYPAYLLSTVSAGGMTASRVASTIDATLATGNPVVIGMHVYGGTHFVVLVSGVNGHYVMKDPYVANGNDIDFSSYYSLREIYSIAKVTHS